MSYSKPNESLHYINPLMPTVAIWVQLYGQGRLRHINDGANAPWNKYGVRFMQNFSGTWGR